MNLDNFGMIDSAAVGAPLGMFGMLGVTVSQLKKTRLRSKVFSLGRLEV